MDALSLAERLDREFGISGNQEDLVEWAVPDDSRAYIHRPFLEKRSALMLKAAEEVHRVCTAVFASGAVMDELAKRTDCLLFTHHHFRYHVESDALSPIRSADLERLVACRNSLYVAHAALDTHPEWGTSLALARLAGVSVEGRFYDYFGAPTAVFGGIARSPTRLYADKVQEALGRPTITLIACRPFAEKVAVVAGGGDLPDLLQVAFDLGCDTLLTGTVENRCPVPSVQEANKQFHELNRKLGLNLIGGTHFGTERPAMIEVVRLFKAMALDCEYLDDARLLSAQ